MFCIFLLDHATCTCTSGELGSCVFVSIFNSDDCFQFIPIKNSALNAFLLTLLNLPDNYYMYLPVIVHKFMFILS